MKKTILGKTLAAIDIGTTKICVIVASTNSFGKPEIIGIGQYPSYGLKKGVVVNIGQTVDSIKKAVQIAQDMAGVTIDSAAVGIAVGHKKSFNSTGVVAIKGRDVSQYDIDRVIEAAKAIPIPQDQDILHILPQYFRVDGQEYVLDSLGMYGVRLEAQVHIITGAIASVQNIVKSCELANIMVSDIVLEQIASADAVLTESEREMGVGIIDIGGGTSDMAVYKEGRIRHSKVLPIAGNQFTNDLAIGLGIPREKAEELKKVYGSISQKKGFNPQIIDVSLGFEGGIKAVTIDTFAEILRFRAEELFELFANEIQEFKLHNFMPTGIVLTGGGSLLPGIKEVAEEKLGMPIRLGMPIAGIHIHHESLPDALKSPIYSTGYGLLLYALKDHKEKTLGRSNDSAVTKIFKRMKSWIYDFL
ncbi:MAG: cell division protein FtsA [bacterium]